MVKHPRIGVWVLFLALTPAIAQIPNIRVSNPASWFPEEVTIAINPVNPRYLIAGANLDYQYSSTDGGFTWTEQHIRSSAFGVWGDPCVIFDALGNAYYGHLSNPPSPGYWIDRIVDQQSVNDGITWNDGGGIGFNPPRHEQDKEWLAADMTDSPYRNNVYVAWTEFDSYGSRDSADSSRIVFSRSTDHGLTWSHPVRVSDQAGNCLDSDSTVEGAVPAIGPNGEVYLTWAGPLGIMFDKSTDGGETFGTDSFVTDQPGGWDFNIPGLFRANGMPITACDASHSRFRGNIYVQWADQRNGVDNTDIFFMKSTDGGGTWGHLVRVNDDTTHSHQFFSWMTIDQSNGNIYVVFYDRRNARGDATDVSVAASYDGGESFRNFMVSTSSFTPMDGVFFGDYINIAAMNGRIYPIWMRMDQGILSVWNSILHDGTIITMPAGPDWKMVSVPVAVDDYHAGALFPSARSASYGYNGGYIQAPVLKHGQGYWCKFGPADTIRFNGSPLAADTVQLNARWNMVGSVTVPFPVSSITSNPPGMMLSPFYEYTGNGLYSASDTIRPGCAYWVKADQACRIMLATTPSPFTGRITIQPPGDTPPPPPSPAGTMSGNAAPNTFSLGMNHPNPFNPETRIEYVVPARVFVTLKVFNVLGQEVATLISRYEDPGFKTTVFVPGNLPSGVYYYRMTAGSFIETKKMMLVR